MILYGGKSNPTSSMIIERMDWNSKQAEEGMTVSGKDNKKMLRIAKELRAVLEEEYHQYHLQKIEKIYEGFPNFKNYVGFIVDSYVKTVGKITLKNAFSFLYDVEYYKDYYRPFIK